MATRQSERVEPTRRQEVGSRSGAARCQGTCVRVAAASGSSIVTVHLSGRPDVDLVFPAAPDSALALRLTGGFRRVSWVSIDASGEGARCEVAGLSRRPQRVRLPLSAALALADASVPTLVRFREQVG